MHNRELKSEIAPAIETRDLHVSAGGFPILRGVTFRVPQGELVALIGPNGSGKTTLLRAILGLQRIDSGEVKLFGTSDIRSALGRVGYVPQRLNLERSFILSVREFLALRSRECRGWFWQTHARSDELLRKSLAEIANEPLHDRPQAQPSGGQLQRMLIALRL